MARCSLVTGNLILFTATIACGIAFFGPYWLANVRPDEPGESGGNGTYFVYPFIVQQRDETYVRGLWAECGRRCQWFWQNGNALQTELFTYLREYHSHTRTCRYGSGTLRPQDSSAPRHFGTTVLVPKFKMNHRWSCVSSELSWVEVSRLFLDHGTRVEVSRTTFLVSKCLEIGAEVSQSVLMPKCFVAKVSGNRRYSLHPASDKVMPY